MVFLTLITIWLVSILVAIYCLYKEEWHCEARSYLLWALFPFSLLFLRRKLGIKSWLMFLLSPFMLLAYFIAFMFWIMYLIFSDRYAIPESIFYYYNYYNGDGFKRVTGVTFPDVIPVDSISHETFGLEETIIKFVPKDTVPPSFYQDLEKACYENSSCWRKDSLKYYYSFHIATDSTYDSPHRYIIISVPLSGDTISFINGTVYN